MISVVITSKEEANLVQRAINRFLEEDYLGYEFEIIVVAPDKETLKAAQDVNPKVKVVQDKGISKAAAINLVKSYIHGEKIIFSDGDVIIEPGAVKELLKIKADAVTGQPVYLKHSQERQPYKFWQECLLDTAHRLRSIAQQKKGFILLSGYLFLIKGEILRQIDLPENLLAEDEFLSYWLWNNNFSLAYAPQAKVLVKYPNNYHDWLKQKIRILAGTYQIPQNWKQTTMRSFKDELWGAGQMWKNYVANFKQAIRMMWLFLARLQAWCLAYLKFKVLKQNKSKIWQRVESSK